MTYEDAKKLFLGRAPEFMLGMYTERWLKALQGFPHCQKRTVLIDKEAFNGEVPVDYFLKHA